MADLIKLTKKGDISMLTVDRPELRNALSSTTIDQLRSMINILHKDSSLRALIIAGAGDKAFSAGADLKERQGMTEPETLIFVEKIQRTFQEIAELPIPTIAAINGDAFGGGLELALACDIRVVSAHARLGLTECRLGIIPGAGGTQRLPRLIGLARAMDLIFLAKRIDAKEALVCGLANYLAQDAQACIDLAHSVASTIAENAPLAIRAAKEALLLSQDKSLRDGLMAELASYHEILETHDRKEGLKAFQEKRPPQFRGK